MALTQMQLIQSLGEALTWFERETHWGVAATELRHLCGRIGELYVAMITNGQMATEVNQHGYDVVSGAGERISVKTTARIGNGGSILFNANSLEFVDRVIVLRINTDEMQVEILLDKPIAEARGFMASGDPGQLAIPLSRIVKKFQIRRDVKVVIEVAYGDFTIRELETGSIEVLRNGVPLSPVKPVLREVAVALNVGLLNGNGNPLNTRQLGSQLIKSIQELNAPPVNSNAEVEADAREID